MTSDEFPATLVVESKPAEKEALTLVTCPDKEFQCPDGDTCCQLKEREADKCLNNLQGGADGLKHGLGWQ